MATQYYEYDDDAGTEYGVALTDAQQAMYTALGLTLPTGYATLAALQAAIPTAQNYPTGLASRRINITSPYFGQAQQVILNAADMATVEPTGTTPFPKAPFTYTDSPAVSGAIGEQRLSN
jgi:hypothetical protein